jgi:tRNA pseudouridine38-40 synthase
MKNIALLVSYDGKNFFGWQKTKEGPSIEEELQKALFKIFKKHFDLQAASRTDAKVNAKYQIVNFFTSDPVNKKTLLEKLNHLLPNDIIVLDLWKNPMKFHPSLDCKKKQYGYYVYLGPYQPPFLKAYTWHYHFPVNQELIKQSMEKLLGFHDFSAFTNRQPQDFSKNAPPKNGIDPQKKDQKSKNPSCNISSLDFFEIENNLWKISIEGDRFLYRMVRNIVGTLLDIGSQRISLSIEKILESKDRKLAGITAPPQALFLEKIEYQQ